MDENENRTHSNTSTRSGTLEGISLQSPITPVVGKVVIDPNKDRVIVGRRPISPDGGWGWVVVIGSFLIHVFADGFVYSFGVIVVELLEDLKGGHALTSWIISALVGLTLGIGL